MITLVFVLGEEEAEDGGGRNEDASHDSDEEKRNVSMAYVVWLTVTSMSIFHVFHLWHLILLQEDEEYEPEESHSKRKKGKKRKAKSEGKKDKKKKKKKKNDSEDVGFVNTFLMHFFVTVLAYQLFCILFP